LFEGFHGQIGITTPSVPGIDFPHVSGRAEPPDFRFGCALMDVKVEDHNSHDDVSVVPLGRPGQAEEFP
jgi:hypothetical protein